MELGGEFRTACCEFFSFLGFADGVGKEMRLMLDILLQWIDAETGIGGLMTTQLAPPGDAMFTKCFVDCEEAVYAALRGV